MPEFPENVPTLDPSGAPKCKASLGRRVRAWTLLLVICAVVLGMAVGGVWWVVASFRPGHTWDDQLLALVLGGAMCVPFFAGASVYFRSKWKTGRWIPARETTAMKLAVCRARGCNAKQSSWVTYGINWGSYSAMGPTLPRWRRVAGWAVLAGYAAGLLAVIAFGVICIGAAFADDNTLGQSLLFIGLGMVVLAFPAVMVWRLVRGIREGKVGATREDVEQLQAQRVAWRTREWQKPLRNKLVSAGFLVLVYGLLWIRATWHHAQHPHQSWVTPAMYTPWVLYVIWIQFRRPKGAPPVAGD